MEKHASKILFMSDSRGINLPKDFCNDIMEQYIENYDKVKDEIEVCKQGDNQPCYYDCWHYILATIIINNEGRRYYLHQDGDLFLIPCSDSVIWVTDLEELGDEQLEEMFDNILDDCYPKCKILSYEYNTSRALKTIDPITYRCEFANWLDGELRDDRLFEQDGKYYGEDPTEPEDSYDYWDRDGSNYTGHYEWKHMQEVKA